jgi:chromate reductase, NAD(P)H dehydrogenase (quinone)
MKLLTFAASSNSKSINKLLASYAASLVENADVEILDINDYEMPLFSQDKEALLGQPDAAKKFYKKIGEADAIIISFAEHNGSYTAAYKNLFDWTSRINQKLFQNKPMVLLSTSPGPVGAATVLNAAVTSAPYFDGDVKASVSVPSFFENFDIEAQKITSQTIFEELKQAVTTLTNRK